MVAAGNLQVGDAFRSTPDGPIRRVKSVSAGVSHWTTTGESVEAVTIVAVDGVDVILPSMHRVYDVEKGGRRALATVSRDMPDDMPDEVLDSVMQALERIEAKHEVSTALMIAADQVDPALANAHAVEMAKIESNRAIQLARLPVRGHYIMGAIVLAAGTALGFFI